jgi:hypothetical protein
MIECEAQFYFNKYYTRDSGYYYFTSILSHKNAIYALSQFNDISLNGAYASTAILKFNFIGELLKVDTFHPSTEIGMWYQNQLQIENDSLLYFPAYDSTGTYGVSYNINSGKIKYIKFNTILGKYFFGYPCSIVFPNNVKVFATGEWNRLRKIGSLNYSVIDLVLTSFNQNILSLKKVYQEGLYDIYVNGLHLNKAGGLFFYGGISDFKYNDQIDFTFKQCIYELDTELNLKRKIFSPENIKLGPIHKLIEGDNKSIFTAGSNYTWHITSGGNYAEGDASITKYDSTGNYLWTKTFYNNENYWYDQFNSIILSKDNLSLVAVGNYFSSHHQDSISYDIKKGLIVSISQNGDSLWQRQYIARGTEEYNNINEFLDIKLCPDGGYLLCGSTAINPPPFPDNYSQAGWLMKVDEYGCFIPGCHLVGLKQEANDKMDIKIYPNPAKDFISVIHGHDKILDIDILNLNGVSVKKYKSVNKLETNFLALDNLSSGEYIMNFYERGKLLESKKFLKIE